MSPYGNGSIAVKWSLHRLQSWDFPHFDSAIHYYDVHILAVAEIPYPTHEGSYIEKC